MAAQRRAGRLQRQRGLVLEALAKGLELDRVLLRMARYAERLRSGSRCTILALDQTGERVVSIVAPRRQDAAVAATGRRIDAPPRPFAGCLRSEIGSASGRARVCSYV